MKKVIPFVLVFSVTFTGFATTFAQGAGLSAAPSNRVSSGFDGLPFGTELGTDELAQVEGEARAVAVAVGVSIASSALYDIGKAALKSGMRAGTRTADWIEKKVTGGGRSSGGSSSGGGKGGGSSGGR